MVLIQSQKILQRAKADARDLRRGVTDGHQGGCAFAGLILAQLNFGALVKSDEVGAEGRQHAFGGFKSQEIFLAAGDQSLGGMGRGISLSALADGLVPPTKISSA